MRSKTIGWRHRVALAVALPVLAAPAAIAVDAGRDVVCDPAKGPDRSQSVLTPDSAARTVTVWLSADAGPDEVGVHLEPWLRKAYFVDAGVGTDGSASVAASAPGGSGTGGYGAAEASTDGPVCASSPQAEHGASANPTRASVVAGPGAFYTGYATRTVVMEVGDEANFVNQDSLSHNVMSLASDEEGYPIFESDAFALDTGSIHGVASLAPGDYPFICSFHSNMQGTLTVSTIPPEVTP